MAKKTFNGASSFKVKPDFDVNGTAPLVNFKTVLGALAKDDDRHRVREQLFVNSKRLMSYFKVPEGAREFFEGELGGVLPASGFHLGYFRAQNDQGEQSDFLLVDDKFTGKLLVVGTEDVSGRLLNSLKGADISYVSKHSPDAVKSIDDSIVGAVRTRLADGIGDMDMAVQSVTRLIQSFTLLSQQKGDIMGGTTFGQVIVDNTRNTRPAFAANVLKQ